MQVLVALALAQARAGRARRRARRSARASGADPSNTNLLVTAGTIASDGGRRAAGPSQTFERRSSLNPDLARAHSSLAALDAEEGRRDEALAHWRRALALDPREAPALLAVGLSLLARARRAAEARVRASQLFADWRRPGTTAKTPPRARAWLSSERR